MLVGRSSMEICMRVRVRVLMQHPFCALDNSGGPRSVAWHCSFLPARSHASSSAAASCGVRTWPGCRKGCRRRQQIQGLLAGTHEADLDGAAAFNSHDLAQVFVLFPHDTRGTTWCVLAGGLLPPPPAAAGLVCLCAPFHSRRCRACWSGGAW